MSVDPLDVGHPPPPLEAWPLVFGSSTYKPHEVVHQRLTCRAFARAISRHARVELECGCATPRAMSNTLALYAALTFANAPLTRVVSVEDWPTCLVSPDSVMAFPVERLSCRDPTPVDDRAFADRLPPSLTSLRIGDFCSLLPTHRLPPGLVRLDVADTFAGSLDLGHLPETIRSLRLSCRSVAPGFERHLPRGLTSLSIGGRFPFDLDPAALPLGLRSLSFEAGFHRYVETSSLPRAIEHLAFAADYDRYVHVDRLPPSVRSVRAPAVCMSPAVVREVVGATQSVIEALLVLSYALFYAVMFAGADLKLWSISALTLAMAVIATVAIVAMVVSDKRWFGPRAYGFDPRLRDPRAPVSTLVLRGA